MKLQPYMNKLGNSQQYKEFQKKYADAFLVAGFFVLDFESGQNMHQVDFYIPSKKKIAAFTLDNKVTIKLLDLLNTKAPEKLDIKTNIDLEQIHGILEDEMKNRNITSEIKKVIAVVQNVDGKKIWSLSCILSGMGILTAHVEDDSKTVLKMEKKTLIDIMQRIPASELRAQAQMPKQEAQNQGQGELDSKLDTGAQIKKLNELEQAIEKEKEELQKEAIEAEKETSSQKSAEPKKAKKKQFAK